MRRGIWNAVRVETQGMGIGIKRTGAKVHRNAQVIRKSRPRREQEEREREMMLGGIRRTAEVVDVVVSWPRFEDWAYRVEQQERLKYGTQRLMFEAVRLQEDRTMVELPPVSVRDFLLSARVENPYREPPPVGNYCTSQVEDLDAPAFDAYDWGHEPAVLGETYARTR